MKLSPNAPCPCGAPAKYKKCCRRYHAGENAPTAGLLMRSRYAAYAAGAARYIMETTDPLGPLHEADEAAWRAGIEAFSRGTSFDRLDVIEEADGASEDEAFVTFRAGLTQRGQDASFVERSRFVRRDGRWLYHSGQPVADAAPQG